MAKLGEDVEAIPINNLVQQSKNQMINSENVKIPHIAGGLMPYQNNAGRLTNEMGKIKNANSSLSVLDSSFNQTSAAQ